VAKVTQYQIDEENYKDWGIGGILDRVTVSDLERVSGAGLRLNTPTALRTRSQLLLSTSLIVRGQSIRGLRLKELCCVEQPNEAKDPQKCFVLVASTKESKFIKT
jgi:hypothetical protein